MIPSCAEAFDLQTVFGRALLLKKGEGDVANNGKILGCTIGSSAIGILVKSHIKRLVQLIFNQPVSPGRLCEQMGISG